MESTIKGRDYSAGVASGESKHRTPERKVRKVHLNKREEIHWDCEKIKQNKKTKPFPKGFYNTVYVVIDAMKTLEEEVAYGLYV